MQPTDYIKPIEFKKMLKAAESIVDNLSIDSENTKSHQIKSISGIAFYNILQETKQTEDINVVIIDCRQQKEYEKCHVLESLNIPYDMLSDDSIKASISSSVCHCGIDSTIKNCICFYGDSKETIEMVISKYQSIPLSFHLFLIESTFHQLQQDLPFLLSTSPSLAGVLPLCIIPHKLYISSQEIDSSHQAHFHIHSIININSSYPSISSLQILIQHSSILLLTDNLYSKYTSLFILLCYHLYSPSHSLSDCLSNIHSYWLSYQLVLQDCHLKDCMINTTSISWNLMKPSSSLPKIMKRLNEFAMKYETPLMIDKQRYNLEAISQLVQTTQQCLSIWSVNDLYPLIDYLSFVLCHLYIESIEYIQLVFSLLQSILQLSISSAEEKFKNVIYQLQVQCITQVLLSPMALCILLNNQNDTQNTLSCINDHDYHKCRYSILSCLTAILTTLSTFQVDAYSITGNTAVLDWLKEYSEEKDINKEGATWVEWISDYLLQIVSIDTIDSLSFKETELVGICLFSLMNYFDNRDGLSLLPPLLSHYMHFGLQQTIHNAGGCFGWLREAYIISSLES